MGRGEPKSVPYVDSHTINRAITDSDPYADTSSIDQRVRQRDVLVYRSDRRHRDASRSRCRRFGRLPGIQMERDCYC